MVHAPAVWIVDGTFADGRLVKRQPALHWTSAKPRIIVRALTSTVQAGGAANLVSGGGHRAEVAQLGCPLFRAPVVSKLVPLAFISCTRLVTYLA